MRAKYPSEISREQFEQIRPLLEGAGRKTAPRKVDLYEVFCAVLYLLRRGCQWRMLPDAFPKWRTVHSYFQILSEPDDAGVRRLERALKKSGWRGPRETPCKPNLLWPISATQVDQVFKLIQLFKDCRDYGCLPT